MKKKQIRVMVIDDSALVRQTLVEILQSDPEITVIATASDPFIAAEKLKLEVPDVITLDIEMPKMDGITFLQKIMTYSPIPVVICSSLTGNSSASALKALEYGAVEIITKPNLGTKQFLEESHIRICDIVKAASLVNVKKYNNQKIEVIPKLTADAMIPETKNKAMIETTEKVVAVGASTGGTEALKVFLENLPLDSPGVVIVQHMPENFTRSFANRLDTLCKISVKEAENNDTVIKGRALIAPGNKHMLLKRSGARYYVEIREGPYVCRHRPSVDVLFRSVARYAGKNAVGVILTGMGDDGARGMLEMKNVGAFNIAQDEKSCVVFGMPNEAIKRNAVDKVLPLNNIPAAVIRACS
jgi:two-component system chemotaxis response regulator CheB